jgi:hypothetical protein
MTIEALRNRGCILMECISGSRAYNLDTPLSDTDIKGVFYLPKDMFLGLEYIPQISNETNDVVFYELGRYVELLLKNNPNILELLVTPTHCILYKNPILDVLTPEMFLSKLCKETFANYAISQIKKARGLKKKINNPMDEKRKTILDFCFVIQDNGSIPMTKWLEANGFNQEMCGLSKIPNTKGMYALYYDNDSIYGYKGIISDELSNDVSLSSIPKGEIPKAHLFCNLESYSVYCKEYREYWDWIEKRNDTRYQNNLAHGKNYDSKNMMHTIRLLQMANEIIADQKVNVWRSNRDELLSIKSGEMEFQALMDLGDILMNEIDQNLGNCPLPEAPDHKFVERILVEIRSVLYK